MPSIHVLLSPEQIETLNTVAESRDLSTSSLVRMVVFGSIKLGNVDKLIGAVESEFDPRKRQGINARLLWRRIGNGLHSYVKDDKWQLVKFNHMSRKEPWHLINESTGKSWEMKGRSLDMVRLEALERIERETSL